MKRITIGLITAFIFLMGLMAHAQDCKVLVKEIAMEYKGDCKKGLAHGKGIATGPGFRYEGEFKKGYPDGVGTLSIEENGKVFTGEWKRGEVHGEGSLKENGNILRGYFKGKITGFLYMGEKKSSLLGYNIIEQKRMENATIDFIKSDEMEDHKILLKITENRVRQINNFEVLGKTSGIVQRVDNSGGRLMADIDDVSFPVTLRIQYMLPYGTQDSEVSEGIDNLLAPSLLRFTISEPGFWTVNITHR